MVQITNNYEFTNLRVGSRNSEKKEFFESVAQKNAPKH